jgi:hypothetical protein
MNTYTSGIHQVLMEQVIPGMPKSNATILQRLSLSLSLVSLHYRRKAFKRGFTAQVTITLHECKLN